MIHWISLVDYLPLFISDFINLGLLAPKYSQIFQRFVNVVYFFKEPAFCFTDSLFFVLFLFWTVGH
jgi:hypothetical protein